MQETEESLSGLQGCQPGLGQRAVETPTEGPGVKIRHGGSRQEVRNQVPLLTKCVAVAMLLLFLL